MKILITGATGLLGRAVYNQLNSNKEIEATGIGFSRAELPLIKLNLRDNKKVSLFLEEKKPDLIIHCAAERRPDVSEADPSASEQLNIEVTRNLANISEKLGCSMIYISTDYVFDGSNPPYYADSETNPLNFYGKTKLAGEKAVTNNLKNFTILRVPILYGSELYPGESSIGSIYASLSKNRGGKFDDIAVRYPSHTEDVAIVLDRIISASIEGKDITGIFHFSGNEALTKYKMAEIMASFMNINVDCIYPDRSGSGAALRPRDSHLDTSRLRLVISLPGRSFEDGIKLVLERFYLTKTK